MFLIPCQKLVGIEQRPITVGGDGEHKKHKSSPLRADRWGKSGYSTQNQTLAEDLCEALGDLEYERLLSISSMNGQLL